MKQVSFEELPGILLTPLKIIDSSLGSVMHAMKASSDGYNGFGEAYFSTVQQGQVKGWKKHAKMTLNLIVPHGSISFLVCHKADNDEELFTILELNRSNYQRVTIAPGYWVAFKGIDEQNILLNIANLEHDPTEAENIPYGALGFPTF